MIHTFPQNLLLRPPFHTCHKLSTFYRAAGSSHKNTEDSPLYFAYFVQIITIFCLSVPNHLFHSLKSQALFFYPHILKLSPYSTRLLFPIQIFTMILLPLLSSSPQYFPTWQLYFSVTSSSMTSSFFQRIKYFLFYQTFHPKETALFFFPLRFPQALELK